MKGYDSHLIFCELRKLDVKIDVIANRLENYMAFMTDKSLVFINSFMNSSPEKLVYNLSDSDFNNLTQEFDSKNLELYEAVNKTIHVLFLICFLLFGSFLVGLSFK